MQERVYQVSVDDVVELHCSSAGRRVDQPTTHSKWSTKLLISIGKRLAKHSCMGWSHFEQLMFAVIYRGD